MEPGLQIPVEIRFIAIVITRVSDTKETQTVQIVGVD